MIDPNVAPLNTPLWCVYGPNCFPTVFCCMINEPNGGGRAIWGYSVYKRSPGFRTLGQMVGDSKYCGNWIEENSAKFFLTQDEAFDYLKQLTTPKKSALDKLKR